MIFTNYQFYVDAFIQLCRERLSSGQIGPDAFVSPGNVITRNARLGGGTTGTAPERVPQMPAYHLVEPGYRGITLINIGTGPSNARNVTDHVAVLRPHAWLMLGHCAGLRNTQRLGDYVLASLRPRGPCARPGAAAMGADPGAGGSAVALEMRSRR